MKHIPVLLKEIVEILDPQPGEFFIDGTAGEGGQAKEILKRLGQNGRLLALDLDEASLDLAKKNLPDPNVIFMRGNYADLPEILKKNDLPPADGLLLDLGFCSRQLESGRGFSFRENEPLDMRYDQEGSLTAAKVINDFPEDRLIDVFSRYGEEKFSKRIAQAIINRRVERRIEQTKELAEIVMSALPGWSRNAKSVTRIFQAIRIEVNQELRNLDLVLESLPRILSPGGRVAIISFHSLEDRLVKNRFREGVKENQIEVLTKKPIGPSPAERAINPRSRSAKLRAAKIK